MTDQRYGPEGRPLSKCIRCRVHPTFREGTICVTCIMKEKAAYKPVAFVGEAPGPSGKEGFAGDSGKRLAKLLGLEVDYLQGQSIFLNLLRAWPGPESQHHQRGGKGSALLASHVASADVSRVFSEIAMHGCKVVVFLGKRVARAVDFAHATTMKFMEPVWDEDRVYVAVPHPSGVSRWWNKLENVEQFAQFALWLRLVQVELDRLGKSAMTSRVRDGRLAIRKRLGR